MNTLRVIVCGGRDFDDKALVFSTLAAVHAERGIRHLWHGGARGADSLAGEWGRTRRELSVHPTPARWTVHGKKAGPIRNQSMLGNGIDLVIAFPGGRGTADMVARARAAGVEVMQISQPVEPNGPG